MRIISAPLYTGITDYFKLHYLRVCRLAVTPSELWDHTRVVESHEIENYQNLVHSCVQYTQSPNDRIGLTMRNLVRVTSYGR